MVLILVILVGVGGRDLVCAVAIIVTFVEVLTVDTRVDVLIIVSNVAVDLLMDALTGILRRGVLTNIDIDALVNANGNVFAGAMTTFEFAMSGPLE